MSSKVILLLLLVAAGLGAVLYFTNEKAAIEETAETTVLDGRSLRNATRIRWQMKGRPAVEVGRAKDGRFEMKEPLVDIMSAGYMRQIVDSWDSANMRQTPLKHDDEGLAQAGLVEPELTFAVEWDDGHRMDFAIGDEGPLGTTRFLQRDDVIWEVDGVLHSCLHVGMEDLRERSVFRHAFRTAHEVRVDQRLASGKREALHLKSAEGGWKLLAPIEGRADAAAAERFVTSVVGLRVDYFQPGGARVPARDADIKITVIGSFGEERVEVWEQDGQIWGLLPERGHIFTADNRQYSRIFVNAAEFLRSRMLVPMGEDTFEQLGELIIDPGQGRGTRIRLARDSQHEPWRLIEPFEYECRATPVNEAAHALQQLVAREFVEDEGGVRPRANDPKYGLKAGRWSITTKRLGSQAVNTLWFGSDVGGGEGEMVYCCREDEPDHIAIVPKAPFERLLRPWTAYVVKRIVAQPATITQIDVRRPDGTLRQFINKDGVWQCEGVEGERAEVGEFANDVLRDFVGRKAIDMREGFGEPDWLLIMGRREGDILGEVRVWDRGEDQPLICRGRGDEPVGFEVGKRDTRELRALWK